MITILKSVIHWLMAKFATGASVTPATRPNYIYMKRITFGVALVLALWALFSPKTLAAYLWQAEAIIPPWFYSMLAAVFAGVW